MYRHIIKWKIFRCLRNSSRDTPCCTFLSHMYMQQLTLVIKSRTEQCSTENSFVLMSAHKSDLLRWKSHYLGGEISVHSSSRLLTLVLTRDLTRQTKAPVTFIFPDSFTAIELSHYVLLLYRVENTLKDPLESQTRLCVHACPFLTAPAESWIKARQHPHEPNESLYCRYTDLHVSVYDLMMSVHSCNSYCSDM